MNRAASRHHSGGLTWFKSSYSSDAGGNCLEVAAVPENLPWSKSSYSSDEGGNCVEVATPPAGVFVRDSKNLDGPVLAATSDAWSAFVRFAVRTAG
ncbi:MAG TPA: DUF397 domain-containing protein [Streptomyces sp.]|nr:DUF397 domain-containing protein [Streptomyces sp.]